MHLFPYQLPWYIGSGTLAGLVVMLGLFAGTLIRDMIRYSHGSNH